MSIETLSTMCIATGHVQVPDTPPVVLRTYVDANIAPYLNAYEKECLTPILCGTSTNVVTRHLSRKERHRMHDTCDILGICHETIRLTVKFDTPEGMGKSKARRIRRDKARNAKMPMKLTTRDGFVIPTNAKLKARVIRDQKARVEKVRLEKAYDFFKDQCNECGRSYFISALEYEEETSIECPHCEGNTKEGCTP